MNCTVKDLLGKKETSEYLTKINRLRYLVFTLSIVTFRETVMSEARHSLFIVHFSYN